MLRSILIDLAIQHEKDKERRKINTSYGTNEIETDAIEEAYSKRPLFTCCCVSIILSSVLFIFYGFSIAAIIIGSKNQDVDCMIDKTHIVFSFPTFLIIYGSVDLGINILTSRPDNEFFKFIVSLYPYFNLAWFIVGSVLLFLEVEPECKNNPDGKQLWTFGTIWFGFEIIGIFIKFFIF